MKVQPVTSESENWSGLTVIYFDDKDKNIYAELPPDKEQAKKLSRLVYREANKIMTAALSMRRGLAFCGAPTYRKNEHGNIQGKSTGIVLRGGIAAVGL